MMLAKRRPGCRWLAALDRVVVAWLVLYELACLEAHAAVLVVPTWEMPQSWTEHRCRCQANLIWSLFFELKVRHVDILPLPGSLHSLVRRPWGHILLRRLPARPCRGPIACPTVKPVVGSCPVHSCAVYALGLWRPSGGAGHTRRMSGFGTGNRQTVAARLAMRRADA